MAQNTYEAMVSCIHDLSRHGADVRRVAYLIEHGIECAPAFNALDYESYLEIHRWAEQAQAEENDALMPMLRDIGIALIAEHLEKHRCAWDELGRPPTAEDWMRRKYPDPVTEGDDNEQV